jgi:hypothetical protein
MKVYYRFLDRRSGYPCSLEWKPLLGPEQVHVIFTLAFERGLNVEFTGQPT